MIPFVELPPLHVYGPFTIYPFGLLVLTGVVLGALYMHRQAKHDGIPTEQLQNGILYVLVFGFFFAHVLDVVFYFPERIAEEGWITLFKMGNGISSYGGFIGGALGAWIYYRFFAKKPLTQFLDLTAEGLTVGWVFGRLGCSVAHDHPGRLSDAFFAVNYPGGPRFDLGLYEFLYTLLVLMPAVVWLRRQKNHRKPRPPIGTSLVVLTLLYAPVRFGLDFLRATDMSGSDLRYLGLTMAQYVSVGAALLAIVKYLRIRPLFR